MRRKLFISILRLQLALRSYNLNNRSAIAQAKLSTLYLRHKPDLLPALTIALRLADPPHLRHQLVTRLNRTGKSRLEFLEVGRIAAAESLQNTVCGGVPRVQAVNDAATEAHLLAWLGSGVERVIVTIQAVEKGRFIIGLLDEGGIRSFSFRRGEVDSLWA